MENLTTIGVDLNYWYPVTRAPKLRRGTTLAATVWGQHIVVFRDEQGAVHAMANRCAHRKVALDPGQVQGCHLVCPYHGWEYNPDGSLHAIPHWSEGRPLPRVSVQSYPVREHGGLVWVFPGEAERAAFTPLPDTAPLETDEWFSFTLDNEFHNHYGIGIVNGMDYYHFHLHRRFQPWSDIRLVKLSSTDDSVTGEYEIISTRGAAARLFKWILGDQAESVTRSLKVHYLYPHHLAELGDDMKVWAFFQPVDRQLVRAFITFYVRAAGVQRVFRRPFKALFSPLILRRIQKEDAWAGLQEQTAWDRYPTEPRCETNPISAAVQALVVRKGRPPVHRVVQDRGYEESPILLFQ